MREIYTTPNGKWKIVEQNDPDWQAVFGQAHTYFNAVRVEDNLIVFSNFNLKYIFEWFCEMRIISKDEMRHQIGLLEKK